MNEFQELDRRSKEIFQKVVENYLHSGDPLGSRSLAGHLSEQISPATIRNVMMNLESLGLIDSPHISAGRLPTERGLRFFVDGILEMKTISEQDQKQIEASIRRSHNAEHQDSNVLSRTGAMLSEISKTASLVFAKKQEMRIKHLDMIWLSKEQALLILVDQNGQVDNRIFTPPIGMTPSDLQRAANFINTHINGQTIGELQLSLERAIVEQKQQIDDKMAHLVSIGRAAMLNDNNDDQLVVRGTSNLVEDSRSDEEIETLRQLLDDLETKRNLVELLEISDDAPAVRVFIGSENKLFSLKSSSLVVSPYMNGEGKIIGAVGVIGPTRLNYARIVPMVSYTATLIGKLLENEDEYERG